MPSSRDRRRSPRKGNSSYIKITKGPSKGRYVKKTTKRGKAIQRSRGLKVSPIRRRSGPRKQKSILLGRYQDCGDRGVDTCSQNANCHVDKRLGCVAKKGVRQGYIQRPAFPSTLDQVKVIIENKISETSGSKQKFFMNELNKVNRILARYPHLSSISEEQPLTLGNSPIRGSPKFKMD